jgi:hypothetical protein
VPRVLKQSASCFLHPAFISTSLPHVHLFKFIYCGVACAAAHPYLSSWAAFPLHFHHRGHHLRYLPSVLHFIVNPFFTSLDCRPSIGEVVLFQQIARNMRSADADIDDESLALIIQLQLMAYAAVLTSPWPPSSPIAATNTASPVWRSSYITR